MSKKPTIKLPKFVQPIINGGREYFYFQRGRGSASPGPRLKLPKGPHDLEFWAACKSHLGSEPPLSKTFDALITEYKLSPEVLAQSTCNAARLQPISRHRVEGMGSAPRWKC